MNTEQPKSERVAPNVPTEAPRQITQLTLGELWLLRDRSTDMTGQYELAIQLLFARKNGLPLTNEQNADLDAFVAQPAAGVSQS
jgi:hypothetical protein